MKKFLTIVALLFATLTVNSQSYKLVVRLKDKTSDEYLVNDIDTIRWFEVHDYVDLGLSVCWATCNVGAKSPEETGDYFAWGETEPYYESLNPLKWKDGKEKGYVYENYFDPSFEKYDADAQILALEDDAAFVNWGDEWRMPTMEECNDLMDPDNCSWKFIPWGNTEFNGVGGFKIQSLRPGYTDNFIFIPAVSQYYETELANLPDDKYYADVSFWSSTPLLVYGSGFACEVNFKYDKNKTHFDDTSVGLSMSSRCCGDVVRAVCDNPNYIKVTDISLSATSLTMSVGENQTLSATLAPANATRNTVYWSSSDESVATVDHNGNVIAVSKGSCTIYALRDGCQASCQVTVTVSAEYAYVDLGLSVKWATFNVGAKSPEEYGDYFAWGETETKSDYSWSTYKYSNGDASSMTKYCTKSNEGTVDGKTVLELEDDAAHVIWGGSWRMPTGDEMQELINTDNCTWTWLGEDNDEYNGVAGYKVTSRKPGYEGKSIFLPATGRMVGTELTNPVACATYWCSSLYSKSSSSANYLSYYGILGADYAYGERRYGAPVRPVCK